MKHPTFLLIAPYLYDFSAYDLWSKPLGLLYIAAILEENGGRVLLVDAMDRWNPEVLKLQKRKSPKSRKFGIGHFYREITAKPEIFKGIERYYARYGAPPAVLQAELEKIRSEHPSMILVTSGMTYWYQGVQEAIAIARSCFPGTPVVLGGIYATLCPDHASRVSGADFIIEGPGELPLLRLVSEKMGMKPRKVYESYDDYPMPAYHLYPRLDYVAMTTSRGCPYKCTFCATHRLNPQFHQRTPEKVVEEMEYHISERKIHDIAFYDDALFVNAEKHIKPILRRVIHKGLPAAFHTPNGLFPKMLDEELASLLVQSGFKTIRLSYETKNPERQRQMGKVRDADLEKALQNLEKAGFPRHEVTVYLMMGLPHQPRAEVEESFVYATSLGVRVSLSSFSPIPNTPEWKIAVRDFGFPTHDPLYGNKSVYPLKRPDFTYKDFENLKKMALEATQKLLASGHKDADV